MSDADGGGDLIDVLSAGTSAVKDVNSEVVRVDGDFYFFSFRSDLSREMLLLMAFTDPIGVFVIYLV